MVKKADQPLVDQILKSLDENDRAVERAMYLLGERQTSEELAQQATFKHNAIGFTSAHARFGAWVHSVLKAGGHLQPKAMATARMMAKQYARTQLLDLAKEKLSKEGK